jgi:hypothetical protein
VCSVGPRLITVCQLLAFKLRSTTRTNFSGLIAFIILKVVELILILIIDIKLGAPVNSGAGTYINSIIINAHNGMDNNDKGYAGEVSSRC